MAFAVKAVVPAGFMLSRSADGMTIITICASGTMRDVYYDAKTNTLQEIDDAEGQPQESPHDGQQACPFASAYPAAFAGPAIILPLVLQAGSALFSAFADRVGNFLRPIRDAAPRAPPALSFL